MKFNSFLGDMRIASQPERLTFHNMAYVFATCEEPRITFDDKTGITDVWAANDVVSNKLSNIFWDVQTGGKSHKFLGLDVYPILYLVSSEERKSMEGIEALENNYILSAVMLTYRVEHISNKTNPPTKTVANYSIVLEQSLDGFLVTLKQVMVMLLNTAINYNRSIKHCPYQDMKFNIVIPLTLMDEIECRLSETEVNPFMDSGLLVDFLRNHYKAKADQLKNKINFNNVTIDTINDRTIRSMHKNMPTPYLEVMDAFKHSFDSNPFEE